MNDENDAVNGKIRILLDRRCYFKEMIREIDSELADLSKTYHKSIILDND